MKSIVISDIHLGHRNTPTKHVIKNLWKYTFNKKNSDVDVIFIAGDLFDRLLDGESNDFKLIVLFWVDLLNYCYKHKIKLRVLKGTPGHEYNQLKTLCALNDKMNNPIDLKYFDVLDIDYMPEFNKYVLYIPDEWSNDHKLIETQIKEKMDSLGIVNVDMAILHSLFGYQMEGIPYKGFRYDEAYFLNLVKEYIVIGHVHNHSSFDRIIAGGGFDRYSHGEEGGKKGCIRIDGDHWIFVENENPFSYVTINITKNETLTSLDNKVNKFPEDTFVRLRLTKDHPFNLNFKELTSRYYRWRVSRLIKDTKNNKRVVDIMNDENVQIVNFETLNMDIESTLRDIILDKYSLSETGKEILDKHLAIFKNSNYVEEEQL